MSVMFVNRWNFSAVLNFWQFSFSFSGLCQFAPRSSQSSHFGNRNYSKFVVEREGDSRCYQLIIGWNTRRPKNGRVSTPIINHICISRPSFTRSLYSDLCLSWEKCRLLIGPAEFQVLKIGGGGRGGLRCCQAKLAE